MFWSKIINKELFIDNNNYIFVYICDDLEANVKTYYHKYI